VQLSVVVCTTRWRFSPTAGVKFCSCSAAAGRACRVCPSLKCSRATNLANVPLRDRWQAPRILQDVSWRSRRPRQSGCAREELLISPSPIEAPAGRVSADELQGDNQADELLRRGEFGSRYRFHPAIASLSPGNGFPRQPFYAALPRSGISLRSLDRARPTHRVSVGLEGLYT